MVGEPWQGSVQTSAPDTVCRDADTCVCCMAAQLLSGLVWCFARFKYIFHIYIIYVSYMIPCHCSKLERAV